MARNPFERFLGKNLDNDETFDKEVMKGVAKVIDQVGVNMPGLQLAYEEAVRLNGKRETPQHKNYLLNLVKNAALNSNRFHVDLVMQPNLQQDVIDEVEKMKQGSD